MRQTKRNKDINVELRVASLQPYRCFDQGDGQNAFAAAAAIALLCEFCAHFRLRCCDLHSKEKND